MRLPPIIQKLLKEYFRYTAIGLGVLVLALGYVILLNKKVQSIQTTSFTTQNRAQNELNVAKSSAARLHRTIDTFNENFTAEKNDKLQRLLPTEIDFPELLLSINKMANTIGLSLDSIDVVDVSVPTASEGDTATGATGEQAPSLEKLSAKDIIVVVSRGQGYDQFKQFLGVIEGAEPLLDVTNLTYTATGASDEGGKANETYTFTFRTYYLTPPVIDSPQTTS